MDKIAKFKEFIAKVERERLESDRMVSQMGREVLQDFLSDEINVVEGIEEILRDYKDDGFAFDYTVWIRDPETEGLVDVIYSEKEINLLDGILKYFSKFAVPHNVEYWKEHGHAMQLLIIVQSNKNKKNCVDEIVTRLKSALPQVTVDRAPAPSVYDIGIVF